ncbi:hypothetical protein [Saccharothrix syringae]|uniref:hypothetical protein n=1 Tax=Saccharothrix syringae TaxID=103733 RepID=UPI000AD0F045|nr:hypothetical protein [Saccharothrix syringae]
MPRQLPAAPGLFAGQAAELAALDRVLASDRGAAVMISAIGGVGGIGKTWLAPAWAHRNLHRFPDGQLFVDLHGFSPTGRPTEHADALRGFLPALGADPEGSHRPRMPSPPGTAALVAGRRMLVVLDNAANPDQVVPPPVC